MGVSGEPIQADPVSMLFTSRRRLLVARGPGNGAPGRFVMIHGLAIVSRHRTAVALHQLRLSLPATGGGARPDWKTYRFPGRDSALPGAVRRAGVARLAWLDSAGRSPRAVSPSIDPSRQAETPRLSPDGNRLALAAAGDLQRGTATRLTFDAALNRHPVWTADGQHIVYNSDVLASDGEFGIWWIRSDGSSQPEKLFGERTLLQVSSIVVLAPPESRSEEPPAVHATIMLNYFDDLRRHLPAYHF